MNPQNSTSPASGLPIILQILIKNKPLINRGLLGLGIGLRQV